MENKYDIVVIGAGSAGLTAAVGATKIGKKVLLVEREHMGGECTNTGCIPSKALLHVAKQFHEASGVTGIDEMGETYRTEAFTYVRKVIDGFLEHETPETFKKIGMDVIMGDAIFGKDSSIKVGETRYEYDKAIIATGSKPRMLHIDDLEEDKLLTNQNFFEQTDIPEKLLVIGGGPIGLEVGQAMAMLGCHVTIATNGNHIAHTEDEAIRNVLEKNFADLGIDTITNAHIDRVEGSDAVFEIKKDEQVVDEVFVSFDKVLLAIGREPNLPMGLEDADIKHDERHVIVDSQFRTSNKNVYAVGDVSQRLKFTHTADDTSRQVITRIATKGLSRVSSSKSIPKVTYTSPEIAQVGISWQEALDKYSEDQVVRIEVPLSMSDRATTDDATDGLVVVIAKRLSGKILGAHMIGPRAGEIISTYTLAIDQKISLWKLQKTIFAYPTYSLLIKKSGDLFVGQQFGNLKSDLKNLFKRNAAKLVAASLWVSLMVFLTSYQDSHGMTSTDTALAIFDFISMTSLGALVYILFYTIRPITFLPATALTILSGVFFGFVQGTILTVIAATLSSAVAYFVGRFFGSGLRLEDGVLGKWVEALRDNTFEATLITRLTFLPFDIVSYAAGILQTKFIPFVTATFFGIILGTATFVSIGASLDIEEFKMDGLSFDVIDTKFLLLSAVIFIASILLSRFLKNIKSK